MSETPAAEQTETQSNSAGAQVTEGANTNTQAADAPAQAQAASAAPAAKKGKGAKGRKRPPEEIERAKASAKLTRQVAAAPSMLKGVALSALAESKGVGPAMVSAFGAAIQKDYGVTFAVPALRAMLERLADAGILAKRKFGTRYDWLEGNGRPTVKAGKKAAAPKAPKAPKGKPGPKPGKKAAAALPRIKVKLPPGRQPAFRGGDAAAALVDSLTAALAAARALHGEIQGVARMRDQLNQIIRQLS